MSDSSIQNLLAKAVQGDLSPDESLRLAEACRKDPKLTSQLADLISVDRCLPQVCESDSLHFSQELIRRIRTDQEPENGSSFANNVVGKIKRKKNLRIVTAAAASIACLLALFFALKQEPEVARIVSIEASEWQAPSSLKVGDRITFEQGLISLHYAKGVDLLLEAPADFEITSATSGYLHHGKLVAEIDDKKARGFTIDGPSGKIIDLGTKFGVSVASNGDMEVHVLEGIVDATPTNGKTTRLQENEAMSLGKDHSARLPMAYRHAFVTRLPEYQDQAPNSLRWSFDESDGLIAKSTNQGLAQGNADARFLKTNSNSEGPQRIEGVFGNAIQLDGKGAYLESDFSGIEGTGPRTVAFWARTPKDFGEQEGFGIINWGTYARHGSAWQASINSVPEEGALGRLRIGTNEGAVVGVTDLRDDRWHHCAIVMYGDRVGQPNTSTHILLYVDGQLESTSQKSIQTVDTAVEHKHGIWLGRNLSHTNGKITTSNRYGRFFRGDVDEVIVFDTALSAIQIQGLMRDNKISDQ